MKKTLLIGAGALVILWLGATAIIGANTKSQLEQLLAQYQKAFPFVEAEITDYEKGFFSSKGAMEVRLPATLAVPSQLRQEGDTIGAEESAVQNVALTVRHGPILFGGLHQLGYAHVTLKITDFNEVFQANPVSQIYKEGKAELSIGISRDLKFLYSLPKGSFTNAENGMTTSLSLVRIGGGLSKTGISAYGTADTLSAASGNEETAFSFQNVHFDFDASSKLINGLYNGAEDLLDGSQYRYEFDAERLALGDANNPAKPNAVFSNLRTSGGAKARLGALIISDAEIAFDGLRANAPNGLVDIRAMRFLNETKLTGDTLSNAITVDLEESTAPDLTFGPLDFNAQITGLDAQQMADAIKVFTAGSVELYANVFAELRNGNLTTRPDSPEALERNAEMVQRYANTITAAFESLQNLVNGGMTLTIDDSHYRDQFGRADLDLEATLAEGNYDFEANDLSLQLATGLSATGTALADVPFVQRFLAKQLPAAFADAPEEQRSQVLNQMLEGVIAQGMTKREGDRLRSDLEINDGAVIVNGNPVIDLKALAAAQAAQRQALEELEGAQRENGN
ncbi:MAG: DUF945 family protein [Pseudomonadota bacterium]